MAHGLFTWNEAEHCCQAVSRLYFAIDRERRSDYQDDFDDIDAFLRAAMHHTPIVEEPAEEYDEDEDEDFDDDEDLDDYYDDEDDEDFDPDEEYDEHGYFKGFDDGSR